MPKHADLHDPWVAARDVEIEERTVGGERHAIEAISMPRDDTRKIVRIERFWIRQRRNLSTDSFGSAEVSGVLEFVAQGC